MNKKGFTLIELLAVIVILAIVMLVAVTSIGPMMEKSRKSALGSEGIALIKAATSAYSQEGLKGENAAYTSTSTVCLSLKYLCENGYFEKGCGDDNYTGSVLVSYMGNGQYDYYFWISNGTYAFNAATVANYGNIDDDNIVYDSTFASEICGLDYDEDLPEKFNDANETLRNDLITEGKITITSCDDNCTDTQVQIVYTNQPPTDTPPYIEIMEDPDEIEEVPEVQKIN